MNIEKGDEVRIDGTGIIDEIEELWYTLDGDLEIVKLEENGWMYIEDLVEVEE